MQHRGIFTLSLILMTACGGRDQGGDMTFLNGGDISFLPEMEHFGAVYSDDEGEADAFAVMKRHGFNSIRLKLWHTPDQDYNTLDKVAAMAQRIRKNEMHFLLNFHYSDWWADPGKQIKPKAWETLDFQTLKDSLYQYSKDVLDHLVRQGIPPQMVQIGNEIRPGLLWPEGRVGGEYENDQQWDQLAELLAAARQGVLDGMGAAPTPQIMVHFDNGAKNEMCRHFYDQLAARGVEFDVIGLSFYPKWHGNMEELEFNLADLTQRYGKPVVVVEAAYPWTLDWNDDANNIWSEADLHEGYPPTVEGQSAYFTELRRIIKSVPNGMGIGLYYWAPTWITAPDRPSSWENAALFDFDGKVLPGMDAFTGYKKK